MTYEPQTLSDLQEYMRIQTGLPYNELGTVPDPAHNGGYHCGWDRRRLENGALDDYSWQESARDWNHKTDAARAFDCGMFPYLRELSIWMVNQCVAGAPDTLDIREIIYSPDGNIVKRWDRLGIQSGGSDSHLTHTHFSWFADAEENDKTSPFQRFFEGGGVSTLGEYNTQYRIQNGVVAVQEPNLHIPAGEGHSASVTVNPFGIVLKALVTGDDAIIPEFPGIPGRTWKNGTSAALDQVLAKLDQILAMGPGGTGGLSADDVRAIVREELDKTGLRGI